jgi:hypothetical protein
VLVLHLTRELSPPWLPATAVAAALKAAGAQGSSPRLATVASPFGDWKEPMMPTTSPVLPSPRRRAVLLRLLVGSLTVLVLLGAGRFDAAAAPISISQHAFVQLCKDTGGTPTRVSTYVVKCSYPDGHSSTCNFVTKQCTDYIPPEITPGGNPNASPISGGCLAIVGDLNCEDIGWQVVQVWDVNNDPYGLDVLYGLGNGWTCDGIG